MPAHQTTIIADPPRLGPVAAGGVMLFTGLILGGVTSFAQEFLPDAVNSFANSASGWTFLTALLVWLMRSRTVLSAVLGAVGFLSLVVGYTLVSGLRGYFYSPVLFGIVGLVVGPFVGIAACWLHRHDGKAAIGSALLSGIAIGEGVYGLTVVAETTSPYYWIVIAALGLGLLAVILTRKLKAPGIRVASISMTAGVAIAFNAAYIALGSIPL